MIAKRIFLFALLLTAFQMVSAQILEPVKWSFESKKTGNSEYELRFMATMDNGWHLYSQFVPAGGPIPTSFKFDKSAGFTLVGKVVEPKPLEEHDPNFNMVVKY